MQINSSVHPIGKKILIELPYVNSSVYTYEKAENNIVIPQKNSLKQKIKYGNVWDIGEDVTKAVKIQDLVYFKDTSQQQFNVKSKRFIIIEESDIIGKVSHIS